MNGKMLHDRKRSMLKILNFVRVIQMLSDVVSWCLYQVAMAVLVGLMLLTVVDVTGRFFGNPVLGSYQVSELMQVWMLCLAWPLSIRFKAHVRVEFFLSKFSDSVKKVADYICDSLMLISFILIGWQGIHKVLLSREFGDFVSIIEIPLYPFKMAVPIGALVAGWLLIVTTVSSILKIKKIQS